ncbi:hypothetical protein HYH03_013377 [Edaphochlamys debaryana]|uniref:YdbS-like PH domain-containing protein n=1 Tax=Edaphochlamys debaryana TaxID=47281 RepID=A0A835XYN3_9CHLO|nr:hypothetical protein HYH03_013377 [Edaphochlamys debaryana]|eukprot:KAG2488074.1 hypothetical protein HYH03_013377 [Edaphochlamys debaryana]
MQTALRPTAGSVALPRRASPRAAAPLPVRGRQSALVVRASADDADAELEKRLAKLREAKGATPYGQGVKAQAAAPPKAEKPEPKKKASVEKVVYDFTDEKPYYEGPPHRGDLAINLALGTTLFWLPLTIASIGRHAFVKYKFTDRRVSVSTTAPWKTETSEAAYQEVTGVKSVPRGLGDWGDMVIELKDGSKLELRCVDRFRELQNYVLERRDALSPRTNQLTQEELMGEKPKAKGFA